MNDWINRVDIAQTKMWLESILTLIGIAASIGALWTYWRNSKRERTRWLFELYQRLYEHSTFRKMRVRIDWGDTDFVSKGKDKEQLDELDEHLNLFELIAYLHKTGELKRKEVEGMFDYPLRKLCADKNIFKYVSDPTFGYEGIRDLLRRMGYSD